MVNKFKGLSEFAGKRVFLTGHTGFKGAWLFYWLRQLGADVKGYALEPETTPALFPLLFPEPGADSVIGNINDLQHLQKEILDFQPDYVFHLAAQPLVRRSYKQPLYTFETNVIGTANVLEVLRQLEKPCVAILITTDKVYENQELDYAYKESDRLGGHDPYSASKACSELVIASYRHSFFHPTSFAKHQKMVLSTRAGNVIGGGDWSEDRLIPDIIKSLNKGVDIEIRNPSAVRPWQHVMEPLAGYMCLALSAAADPDYFLPKEMNAWNFGPDTAANLPVVDIAEQAIAIWGSGALQINVDPHAVHEAKLLQLNISKAVGSLSWKPLMSAEKAVQRTVNWYKNFYQGETAIELVARDLDYYTQNNINNNG